MHGGAVELTWTTGELAVGACAAGPAAWVAGLVLVAAAIGVRRLPGLGPPPVRSRVTMGLGRTGLCPNR